jgi:hypothetical protein
VNVSWDRNDFGSNVIIPNSEVFGDIIIHYNIISGISYEILYLNIKKSDELFNSCNVFKYIISSSSRRSLLFMGIFIHLILVIEAKVILKF